MSAETTVSVLLQQELSGRIKLVREVAPAAPDGTTRQIKRKLGSGGVSTASTARGVGAAPRAARTDGHLDERAAIVLADEVMRRLEAGTRPSRPTRDGPPTFGQLSDAYLEARRRIAALDRR